MPENSEIKWYVVHTYSAYENKVKVNLEKAVENNGMQDLITEVRIPSEDVQEIKNGKVRVIQRNPMPGYVFIRMQMTNETWYIVRNTRGVTGFVGSGNKALPLSETDFAKIFDAAPQISMDIHVGDTVRILTGLFEGQSARVDSIDKENKKLTVIVQLMGEQMVELDCDEVILEA